MNNAKTAITLLTVLVLFFPAMAQQPNFTVTGTVKDMDGVIEAIDEERGRLTLSVFCFGRYNSVDIDFGQVERAQE